MPLPEPSASLKPPAEVALGPAALHGAARGYVEAAKAPNTRRAGS